VFVEGVSQFGKNPVCHFVVLRGQDLSTEFADFIFCGHEVVGETPTYHPGMPLSVPYSTYSMKRIVTESAATKKTRISGAIQRMRVSVGRSRKHQRPAPEMIHLRGRTRET
jgi:hypothetical protein